MNKFRITHLDGFSPLGLNMHQSVTSIAAGLSRYCDHENMMELPESELIQELEPLVISPLAWMELNMPGPEKIKLMLVEQAAQMQEHLASSRLKDTALLWAFPNHNYSSKWNLNEGLLQEVFRDWDFQTIGPCGFGACGLFECIEQAQQLLLQSKVSRCVIGSCDTYLDPERLHNLNIATKLITSWNRDGFFPGEASSVMVIEADILSASYQDSILIGEVGFGKETCDSTGEHNSTGLGLYDALHGSIDHSHNEQTVKWILSDLNGTYYRFYEWGMVIPRIQHLLHPDFQLEHPADVLGYLGANSGSYLLACAAHLMKTDTQSTGMVFVGSDQSQRAAITLYPN